MAARKRQEKSGKWFGWPLFGAIGAVVAFLSQVSPDTAIGNIKAWWEFAFGQSPAPRVIEGTSTDHIFLVLGILMIVVSVSMALKTRFWGQVETAKLPVDLSEWAELDSYYVWAAACLWIGVKPVNQIGADHAAYPSLQMIKGALDAGLISSLDGAKNMGAKVGRKELERLAFAKNQFPKFLFPDQIRK